MAKKEQTKQVSWKARLDSLVRALAYIALIVLASYGMRQMLSKIGEEVTLVFTFGTIGMIVYIIFRGE